MKNLPAEPKGIVFIAEELDEDREPGRPRFYGHWEVGDAADTFIDGPGWDNPEEAIAWGRARADEVYIRVGRDPSQTYYSAGRIHDARELRDAPLPRWPDAQS